MIKIKESKVPVLAAVQLCVGSVKAEEETTICLKG
jgi:hypothetical protein